MPKINFELPVPVDSETAFGKIKKFLSSDNDFKKFDPKVKCTFDESENICSVKGSQFSATIEAASAGKAKDKSNIKVQIEIAFTLLLFKGKIQDMVEKNIKKVFKV